MDFIGIVRGFYETSWILIEFNGILMELYGFQRYFSEFFMQLSLETQFHVILWDPDENFWILWEFTELGWNFSNFEGIEWDFHELYGFLWNVGAF